MSILGRLAVLGVALCTLWASTAAAQSYPAKPIRIICAFPVGGIAVAGHLTAFVKAEIAKRAPVVKASGARVVRAVAFWFAPRDACHAAWHHLT